MNIVNVVWQVYRQNQFNFKYFQFIRFRSDTYRGDSNFNALFTPLTFLVTYFNSGVNPLLYAFLSRNFRKGMRELLLCSFKKGKSKSMQQRIPLHVSSNLLYFVLINIIRFQSIVISYCSVQYKHYFFLNFFFVLLIV